MTHSHCCEMMIRSVEDPDVPISFSEKFVEYSVRVLDGGTSGIIITFCPWCGTKLPESERDKWFDKMEERGLDPGDEISESK